MTEGKGKHRTSICGSATGVDTRNIRQRLEPEERMQLHVMGPLRALPYYAHLREDRSLRARLRCRICKDLTSHYCVTCSSNVADATSTKSIFACCSLQRDCFNQHLERRAGSDEEDSLTSN